MRALVFIGMIWLTTAAIAGYKAKTIKLKKPGQFQTMIVVSGVTFAADLLLRGEDQRDFFYRELASSDVVALRLAVFNNSKNEVTVPLDGIQLIGPDGKELTVVAPEAVAQALLQGFPVRHATEQPPAVIQPTDPRYEPADTRNTVYDRRSYGTPGVGIVLDPGGGGYDAVSAQLIEKDFVAKAFSADPLPPSMTRDRFIYFFLSNPPQSVKGFELRLPPGKGIARPAILRF